LDVQQHSAPDATPTAKLEGQGEQQQPHTAQPSDDGFGDSNGFGDWGGAGTGFIAGGTSAFDFSDLNAALDSSLQAAQTGTTREKSSKRVQAAYGVEADGATSHTPCVHATREQHERLLPEFYITAVQEPAGV
jgi:hypothetical protein